MPDNVSVNVKYAYKTEGTVTSMEEDVISPVGISRCRAQETAQNQECVIVPAGLAKMASGLITGKTTVAAIRMVATLNAMLTSF